MNGWIKLHRKILDNDFLRQDPTARNLFITLLLLANKDTGKCYVGRYYLSELTGIKPDTNYKAQKRLEKEGLIDIVSTSRGTTVSIKKWGVYQQTNSEPSQNQVKTKSKPSNTTKEVITKNREYITKVIEPKAQYGNVDVNAVMDSLYNYLQVKPVKVQAQRIAAQNLINRHGLQPTLYLIKYAIQAQQNNVYAYKISSMQDLWNKQNDLLIEIKKKKTNQITRI